MKVKIKVQCQHDRENIISALANSGYAVKVEEEDSLRNSIYYVVFEIDGKED